MILRVFPRKTEGTPDDSLAFIGLPPENFILPMGVREIHISVSFSYDLQQLEELEEQWGRYAPVRIGGPALGASGGDFIPGLYLKKGYTITSRGCPNKCWFCNVWRREPEVIELPIREGWIEQSDNLLACSQGHLERVFTMLKQQTEPVQLMGLEAARLTPWITDMLWYLRPKQMFFAYDTPDDLDPLIHAGELLRYADFTRSHLRCYVLIGYKGDTFDSAIFRINQVWKAGFMPFAMLWRNKTGETKEEWRRFQRSWTRPAAIRAQIKGTTWGYMI